MLKTKKINDEKVEPVIMPKVNPKKILGYALFPEIYANIFLCARKKSGKTSAIFKILKSCVGKYTKLIMFASTITKDATLIHIVDYFKKKKNIVETYTSIKEGKVDFLKEIIDSMKNENEQENEEEINYISILENNDKKKMKKDKKSRLAPEIVFVFDDLGSDLKTPSIDQLLKTNRHFKCKVILSSQYIHDLSPQSRRQLDYALLFGGHSLEKLEIIYKDLDLAVPLQDFIELYKEATKVKYSFLYIDVKENTYRENFDYEFINA